LFGLQLAEKEADGRRAAGGVRIPSSFKLLGLLIEQHRLLQPLRRIFPNTSAFSGLPLTADM
jgi:hypothetical protein